MVRPRKNRIDESKEEFCNCAHMKKLHTDNGFWSKGEFILVGENHGCCIVNRCTCRKFTWKGIGCPHPEDIDSTKSIEYTKKDWAKIDQAVKEVKNVNN